MEESILKTISLKKISPLVKKSKKAMGKATPSRDKSKNTYSHRDKSLNTPEFNKKVKARRAKAKHDAINRKKNRK